MCETFRGELLVAVGSYSEVDKTHIRKKIINKVQFQKKISVLSSHASYSLQHFLLVNTLYF